MDARTVAWVIGLVFAAGVNYGAFQRVRRDLNGLGRKTARLQSAVLLAAPDEKKDELVRFLAG